MLIAYQVVKQVAYLVKMAVRGKVEEAINWFAVVATVVVCDPFVALKDSKIDGMDLH